jgi:hypothetical protein
MGEFTSSYARRVLRTPMWRTGRPGQERVSSQFLLIRQDGLCESH